MRSTAAIATVESGEPGEAHLQTVRRRKPHVVLVVPRGEAVRNFLYSDTLPRLSERARVTLLSVVNDERFIARFRPLADDILSLEAYPQPPVAAYLRTLVENAHDRWLWSAVGQNNWELRDRKAVEDRKRLQRTLVKAGALLLANRPTLNILTRLEQYLCWKLRKTSCFDELFARIQPDLVFNCSHIHGLAGELPLRVAKRMGIPTAGFIFSWDNLTSRSRIFVPYDYYLVWHEPMREELLRIYSDVPRENVFVTGTPQFDFHFNPQFRLSREELGRRLGIDPARPFILYTTGIDRHFYEEYRHVQLVIRLLKELDLSPRPQLVVRNYVKGTSPELKAMAAQSWADVIFPKVLWDEKWYTPMYEDLTLYSSLIHHATLSINAASTVTLEFLLLDKPVINLDFDPPGTNLPWCMGYSRHIYFDHFKPIAESGATMVARSPEDMCAMLRRGLSQPQADSDKRRALVKKLFGTTQDGRCGERVAQRLYQLAQSYAERS
jgi:hypothetical protein